MFFSGMSNWLGAATLQLPRNWASAWRPFLRGLPQDCVLCGADAAAEPVCRLCADALPRAGACCGRCASPCGEATICAACLRRPFAFDEAATCFEYRFPADRLVQRFKYAADLATGRWLAEALARRVEGEARPDLLVAPPLAGARLRERGFNQGLELAKAVGNTLGVRCDLFALARVRETPSQAGLSRRARLANLRRAFRCRRELRGAHVAIVDDVLTTGATAHAIARELKRAGAGRVSLWVVARAPEPGR